MLPAILVRGAALGFLFLSITLITMLSLGRTELVYGVALFNTGRQIGGLIGIAFLQTFIEDQTAQNRAVLAAHITPGNMEVMERIALTSRRLAAHGMEMGAATRASAALIGKQLMVQASTIAFNTAFFSVFLFFLGAAPCLILSKIVIGKLIARRKLAAEA
jgi:DHA2 family multidrug resistance protein